MSRATRRCLKGCHRSRTMLSRTPDGESASTPFQAWPKGSTLARVEHPLPEQDRQEGHVTPADAPGRTFAPGGRMCQAHAPLAPCPRNRVTRAFQRYPPPQMRAPGLKQQHRPCQAHRMLPVLRLARKDGWHPVQGLCAQAVRTGLAAPCGASLSTPAIRNANPPPSARSGHLFCRSSCRLGVGLSYWCAPSSDHFNASR